MPFIYSDNVLIFYRFFLNWEKNLESFNDHINETK